MTRNTATQTTFPVDAVAARDFDEFRPKKMPGGTPGGSPGAQKLTKKHDEERITYNVTIGPRTPLWALKWSEQLSNMEPKWKSKVPKSLHWAQNVAKM